MICLSTLKACYTLPGTYSFFFKWFQTSPPTDFSGFRVRSKSCWVPVDTLLALSSWSSPTPQRLWELSLRCYFDHSIVLVIFLWLFHFSRILTAVKVLWFFEQVVPVLADWYVKYFVHVYYWIIRWILWVPYWHSWVLQEIFLAYHSTRTTSCFATLIRLDLPRYLVFCVWKQKKTLPYFFFIITCIFVLKIKTNLLTTIAFIYIIILLVNKSRHF